MPKRPRTRRFILTLEYEGTRYSGWQKQEDARTIQGALLAAGAEIFGDTAIDIQGNGRTDAGVHALHYTAHLEVETILPPAVITMRFNDLLPADIVVLEVKPGPPQFHARHHCIGRSYLYRLSRRKTAFGKKHVWWVRDRLDVQAMANTVRLFAGMHDFASFAEKQELKKSTRVMINATHLYESDDLIVIRIVGSHFLWKMVRRMVGILVEVGRHNLSEAQVAALLQGPSDTGIPARCTAPPSGLFFERAFYDETEFQQFLAAAADGNGALGLGSQFAAGRVACRLNDHVRRGRTGCTAEVPGRINHLKSTSSSSGSSKWRRPKKAVA